jgi:hypothetical protein
MKVQSRHILGQTERPLVAEEMHFVPAPHEFLTEAGRQDAAAADRRITRDADLHGFLATDETQMKHG